MTKLALHKSNTFKTINVIFDEMDRAFSRLVNEPNWLGTWSSVGKLVGRKFPLGDHPSIQIEEDVPREIWESEAAAIEPHANFQLRV